MLDARPEEPWGKGLTETGFGRRLWRLLKRGGGYYTKSERANFRKTNKDPKNLQLASTVAANLDGFCDNLNTLPRVQEKPGKKATTQSSRNELYVAYVSPLRCPPIRRLYHLLSDARRRDYPVHLDHVGFDFAEGGEKHWIPIVEKSKELPPLYLRWMNATLGKQACRFVAVKLTGGWIGEICIAGDWYEIAPRSTFAFTEGVHNWAKDQAIAQPERQIKEDFARDLSEAQVRFGALPEQLVATVRGHYQMPTNTETPSPVPRSGDTAATSTTTTATSQPATKSSRKVKTTSGVDWRKAFQKKPETEQ